MGNNNGAFVDLSHFKNHSTLQFLDKDKKKTGLNYFNLDNNIDFVGQFC
jgi:hypothetical protein